MRLLAALLFSVSLLPFQAAHAAPADDLGNCLKENTSGKDRKDLGRWVFLSISVHPDMQADSAATAETRTKANKNMAALVTRLLTESCAAQTKAVAGNNAQAAFQSAFRLLGEVAMMELMSNPAVAGSVNEFTQFIDQKKFEAVLGK